MVTTCSGDKWWWLMMPVMMPGQNNYLENRNKWCCTTAPPLCPAPVSLLQQHTKEYKSKLCIKYKKNATKKHLHGDSFIFSWWSQSYQRTFTISGERKLNFSSVTEMSIYGGWKNGKLAKEAFYIMEHFFFMFIIFLCSKLLLENVNIVQTFDAIPFLLCRLFPCQPLNVIKQIYAQYIWREFFPISNISKPWETWVTHWQGWET